MDKARLAAMFGADDEDETPFQVGSTFPISLPISHIERLRTHFRQNRWTTKSWRSIPKEPLGNPGGRRIGKRRS